MGILKRMSLLIVIMLINVKAKPDAPENKIQKINDGNFMISVKEPPVQGRANVAITKLLAGYFGVATANVVIVSGRTSRNKTVKINQ